MQAVLYTLAAVGLPLAIYIIVLHSKLRHKDEQIAKWRLAAAGLAEYKAKEKVKGMDDEKLANTIDRMLGKHRGRR